MTLTDAFNAVEAAWWIVLGIGFLITAPQHREAQQHNSRRRVLTSAWLIAFGVSDAVEFHTGAWWRPWWLFAWKATCIVALITLGSSYYRERRDAR